MPLTQYLSHKHCWNKYTLYCAAVSKGCHKNETSEQILTVIVPGLHKPLAQIRFEPWLLKRHEACIGARSPAVLSRTAVVAWQPTRGQRLPCTRHCCCTSVRKPCAGAQGDAQPASAHVPETHSSRDKLTEKAACGAGQPAEQISSQSRTFPFGLCLSAAR